MENSQLLDVSAHVSPLTLKDSRDEKHSPSVKGALHPGPQEGSNCLLGTFWGREPEGDAMPDLVTRPDVTIGHQVELGP